MGKITVRYADGTTKVVKSSHFRKRTRRQELAFHRRTEHWRALRKQALARDEHRCTICGGTETLEVHHLHYKTLGREKLRDVVTLCQRCHGNEHQWQARRKRAAA